MASIELDGYGLSANTTTENHVPSSTETAVVTSDALTVKTFARVSGSIGTDDQNSDYSSVIVTVYRGTSASGTPVYQEYSGGHFAFVDESPASQYTVTVLAADGDNSVHATIFVDQL